MNRYMVCTMLSHIRPFKKFSYALSIIFVLFLSVEAHAIPISQNFSGIQLNVSGEYSNGVLVPVALREFAPLLQAGQTITGSITYDALQPDTDPGPYGTYRIGGISFSIPEIGLSVSRTSSSMQISVFNNTPNPDDQFFAYANGVDSFTSNVGLPTPQSLSVLLFGNTSMLANDMLPTSQLNWNYGNANLDFIASDGSWRQVLMTFTPAPVNVPEPSTLLLLGSSLVGIWGVRRRS